MPYSIEGLVKIRQSESKFLHVYFFLVLFSILGKIQGKYSYCDSIYECLKLWTVDSSLVINGREDMDEMGRSGKSNGLGIKCLMRGRITGFLLAKE